MVLQEPTKALWGQQPGVPEPILYQTLAIDPASEHPEQVRQTHFEPLRYALDVEKGNISDAPLDSGIVGPMKPAALSCFFLVDALLFAHATNRTTKSDTDVKQQHHLP